MDDNVQTLHLTCRIYKNYHNDERNLHVHKFQKKISKIINKSIQQIPTTVKKNFSYLQKTSFL